ncbi:tetratricopeptide repeat protein [Psychroserpens algicola]|uniref:tetratricopeptide repeat protein n=1 Tax=Psychroserpens algicola TaxID=1719034 RepID=UPI00195309B9|nr:hypothetical protein [Psychroserpens algicola]
MQNVDSLETVLKGEIDTKERYDTLARLWNIVINADIDKSMSVAKSIIDLGKSSKTDSITYYGYERKAVTHSYKSEFDSSSVYFRKALGYYSAQKAYSKVASIQRNIGQDHNLLESLDSAYYYYDLAEKNFALGKDTVGIGDAYISKSVVNLQRGYYNLGLDYGIKSARIAEKYDNQLELHQTYLTLASIYQSMNDTINAIDYYDKTAQFFKANNYKRQYISMLILKSELYNTTNTLEKAVALVDEGIELSKALEDYSRLGNCYGVKSKLYLTKGDTEKAMKYNDKSLEINIKIDDKYSICSDYKDKATIYLKRKDYNNAIRYGTIALDAARDMNLVEIEMNTQLNLSKSYEGMNNHNAALTAYKGYQERNKEFYDSKKSKQMEELKIVYETEKKEKELALQDAEIEVLRQQEVISKNRQRLLGIGSLLLVMFGGALIYGLRQKMKRNKVEREKLDVALEFKEKELTTHALHLAHKNEVLLDLKSQLKDLKSNSDNSKSYQKVINTINLDINNDQNWEQFRAYFEDVHKDFNAKVMKNYPEVSANDLRLMSLLKMNLSSKEIANILNISAEGVKKARYRLRKKLNLSTEDSLQELVIEL